MSSATAINSVIAIPAIDHGWTVDNSDQFWEPFEFRIFGCTTPTSCSEEGHITAVWAKGVEDSGPQKNADDWTTQWGFNTSYNYFAVASGDRLVGDPCSPGEGEIDALAVGVPEPASLLFLGFGLIGLAAWRWKQAA